MNILVEQQSAAVLATSALDLPQWTTMRALRASPDPGGMSPGDLARELLVSPAAMTHRLDVLEAAELVQRHPHPSDRRALRVELTEAGRTTIDELMPRIRAVVETVVADLTERQQKEMCRLLEKMEHVLSASVKSGAADPGLDEPAG